MPTWRGIATSGMEYPTLFTGVPADPLMDFGPLSEFRAAELTIAHEFCHQYFYGIIGSNEFEEAFLDEGFTEHWGNQVVLRNRTDEAAVAAVIAIIPHHEIVAIRNRKLAIAHGVAGIGDKNRVLPVTELLDVPGGR